MDKATMKNIGIVALVLGIVFLFLGIVGMYYGHDAVQGFKEEYGVELTVSEIVERFDKMIEQISEYGGSIYDDMDGDTVRFLVTFFLTKWRIRFLVLGILFAGVGGLMYAMTNNAQTEAVVQGVVGQIGKTVSDAGSNVARQTKNLTETARLNTAISADEKAINQLYFEIGQSYYQEFVGSEALYQDKLEQITQLKKSIEDKQNQIQLLKSEPTVSESAPVAKTEPVAENAAFCPNCGKQVAQGAKFCTYCGTQMTGAEE